MCLCLKRSLPHHIVLYIGGIKLSVCLSVCLSSSICWQKISDLEIDLWPWINKNAQTFQAGTHRIWIQHKKIYKKHPKNVVYVIKTSLGYFYISLSSDYEDCEMIEMTLSSRHRIRNSSPGGLRLTRYLGHGDSPQYWLSHVDGVLSNRRDREPNPELWRERRRC